MNAKYEKIINEGYTKVNNSVIFNTQISTGAKTLYFVMLALGIKSNEIEHSQRVLAEAMNKSVRTIQRYIKELKDAGLIQVIRRLGYTNIYVLLGKVINKAKNTAKNAINTVKGTVNNFKNKQFQAWYGYSQRQYDVEALEKALLSKNNT